MRSTLAALCLVMMTAASCGSEFDSEPGTSTGGAAGSGGTPTGGSAGTGGTAGGSAGAGTGGLAGTGGTAGTGTGGLAGAGGSTFAPCPDPSVPAGGCTSTGTCAKKQLVPPPDPGNAGRKYPFGMAVDAQYVYWAAEDSYDAIGFGAVWRVLKTGGNPQRITETHARPTSVALDDKYVYFLSKGVTGDAFVVKRVAKGSDCSATCPNAEQVNKADTGAEYGTVLTVGNDQLVLAGHSGVRKLWFDGATWQHSSDLPGGEYTSVAFDGKYVYSANSPDPQVYRITLASMLREPFVTLDGGKGKVLGAGCGAVFAEQEGAVYSLTQGTATSIGSVQPGTTTVRTDAEFVYLGVYNAAGVYRLPRVPTDGGTASLLAGGNVWGLAVDSVAVYWGEHGGTAPGAIHQVIK